MPSRRAQRRGASPGRTPAAGHDGPPPEHRAPAAGMPERLLGRLLRLNNLLAEGEEQLADLLGQLLAAGGVARRADVAACNQRAIRLRRALLDLHEALAAPTTARAPR